MYANQYRYFSAAVAPKVEKSVKSVTAVDADAPIQFPPVVASADPEKEPRFLE